MCGYAIGDICLITVIEREKEKEIFRLLNMLQMRENHLYRRNSADTCIFSLKKFSV